MRATEEKVWNHSSPSSTTLQKRQWPSIYIYIWYRGWLSRNPHLRDLSELGLPNNVNYLANAMTVIRTGQQDYFSAPASQRSLGTLKESEVWKLCKREICTASCDWRRSLCGSLSGCLRFAFCNTPRKMMSQYVFFTEVCAILGDRKRMIHL